MPRPSDRSDFRERHLRDRDFLGAFGLLRRGGAFLLVANRRRIGGALRRTWDLPGGQVEPGETLVEALARELREEIRIEVCGRPEFLFLQEGVKEQARLRSYAWRSFFFAVEDWRGEPEASAEVEGLRWVAETEGPALLDAPYHDSFIAWLRDGGRFFRSRWSD